MGGPQGSGLLGVADQQGYLPGYLDAASGEPLHPVARETLLAALDEGWADPARLYREARRARLLLDNAREVVAALVGGEARPEEVVYSSVLQAGRWHERAGGVVDLVGVDRDGVVDLEALELSLGREGTALLAVQSANHEVGTVQPLASVAALAAARDVPLLVDAAQSCGRVPVPAGWAVLTGSAHKWGGPAGVGVLVVRRGTRWRAVLPEDERGSGRVPGFENVPGALAAAAALQARLAEAEALAERHSAWVERIRAHVPRVVPDTEVVGHPTQRLPHVVTFSCLYVDGQALLTALDREGLAVSSGSSCTSSTLAPSHVLEAMGVLTHGNVRVSLARTTRASDVEHLLEVLPRVVAEVRRSLGADRL